MVIPMGPARPVKGTTTAFPVGAADEDGCPDCVVCPELVADCVVWDEVGVDCVIAPEDGAPVGVIVTVLVGLLVPRPWQAAVSAPAATIATALVTFIRPRA